jgi:hypothetical protein
LDDPESLINPIKEKVYQNQLIATLSANEYFGYEKNSENKRINNAVVSSQVVKLFFIDLDIMKIDDFINTDKFDD